MRIYIYIYIRVYIYIYIYIYIIYVYICIIYILYVYYTCIYRYIDIENHCHSNDLADTKIWHIQRKIWHVGIMLSQFMCDSHHVMPNLFGDGRSKVNDCGDSEMQCTYTQQDAI